MVSTLILLYALNATNPIPTGCFVAAWTLFILKVVLEIANKLICQKDKQ